MLSRWKLVLSSLRGVAGAFLGAYLSTVLWLRAMPFLRWLGSLTILPLFLAGSWACLGYWLLRGLRRREFACLAAYACTFAGFLAGYLTEAGVSPQSAGLAVFLSILVTPAAGLAQGRLLKYTDPSWHADPRRAAIVRAGGAMYNYWPRGGFQSLPLPASFQVGGAICVTGGTIQVSPSIRKGKTFFVSAVRGVLVGPSNGSCVLYDKDRQVLAKFGTSWKNANLFIQYLRSRGVPFYTYSDVITDGLMPEPAAAVKAAVPEAAPVRETASQIRPEPSPRTRSSSAAVRCPRSFSVPLRLPHPAAAVGLIAAGFVLSFFAFAAVPVSLAGFPELQNLMPVLWAAATLTPLLAPPILLALTGQLFPAALEVVGARLYRSGLFLEKELTDLVAGLRQDSSDGCWALLDGQGKILAKFSGRDPEGAMLLEYLGENYTDLVQRWAQERK